VPYHSRLETLDAVAILTFSPGYLHQNEYGALSFRAAGPVHDRLRPMNDDGINPVLAKSQVVYVSAKPTMLFAKLAEDMMTCCQLLDGASSFLE
jgi:hypothetical protein